MAIRVTIAGPLVRSMENQAQTLYDLKANLVNTGIV